MSGDIGLFTNVIAYGAIKYAAPQIAFLNRMEICMGIVLLVMGVVTVLKPLAQPVEIKVNHSISIEPSKSARDIGLVIVMVTLFLYILFW